MNYIDFIKRQSLFFALFDISSSIIYSIILYFGWMEPIICTLEDTVGGVSTELIVFFIGPLIYIWLKQSK